MANFTGKPYEQIDHSGDEFQRIFNKRFSESLEWHVDKRYRIIYVDNGYGWKFQVDDENPFTIEEGDYIEIYPEVYHRILAPEGCSDEIKITIKEFNIPP